jgi:hypothetical protein
VRGEGGVVEYRIFEGVVHGFFTLGKLFPEAREAVALSARSMRADQRCMTEGACRCASARQVFSRRPRRSAPARRARLR